MKVGTFGSGKYKVTFQVGDNKILSYQNLSRDDSANFDEHARQGKKPYLEFTGLSTGQMSIEVIAKASFGVNPFAVEKKLVNCMEKGKAGWFYTGGHKYGKNRWVITSVHRDYVATGMFKGRLAPTEIRLTVSFSDYPYNKKKSKKSSSKTNAGKTKDEKTGTQAKAKKTNYTMYTVVSGDTLWGISKSNYGEGKNYTRIYSANQDGKDGTAVIKDPNKIYPGWVIKIPS